MIETDQPVRRTNLPGSNGRDCLDFLGSPLRGASLRRDTREFVESKSIPAIAAAFKVGREDLIPNLFRGLIERLTANDPVRYRSFIR